ncbi:MAG TPA: hypothetical protein VHN37_12140 [Actinomycetota bacterium]|nr:hypothetical protein [Actinomycetota bacterium]
MGNVDGRATAITVLTPVWPGATLWLKLLFFLGRHLEFTLEKLVTLSFIHYARWTIVTRFPDGGRGERLRYSYLFFESNFNGTWEEYIDAFSEVVPWRMRAIWFTSFGFPGPLPVGPFKDYIRKNEFVANHYWSAYPDAATTEVLSAARLATAAAGLRATAEAMTPQEFRAAYDRMLTSVQHDL